MHTAMTASSFRAGTMAVIDHEVSARIGVPLADGLCASLYMVSWMRKGRFPAGGDWVSIAFDGNPSKDCGLGRGTGCAGGFAAFCDAELPPGRGLDCWKNSAGLCAGNHWEARASRRSEGQGRGTQFLGDVVSAVR